MPEERRKEGAMPKSDPLSLSVPRAELDERARAARMRAQQLEQLFASRAMIPVPARKLLSRLRFGFFGARTRAGEPGQPLSGRRPSTTPDIPLLWPAACTVPCRVAVQPLPRRAAG
jgi:hypothetical protein